MNFECPLPLSDYPSVQLAHGGGGRMTQMLLDKVFRPAFRNDLLEAQHDGARIGELAFTTDSFVVRPLFFPGGNIGSLAVHGTLNDLAMCGAKPLALSAGFILEEGFAMESLWRIVCSMRDAVGEIPIATGDTKVVDRGKGDGCYINTTGIGVVPEGITIDPRAAKPGDAILLSGEIATHGIAILSVREGLEFETVVETDSAWLGPLVDAVLDVAEVHVLRDPTRGGVASTLHEIAQSAGVGIRIAEASIPVRAEVRGACEILGLDPLYVANEGKCLAIVAAEDADKALAAMRSQPLGREAALIGEVVANHAGSVRLKSSIGGERIVDLMSGEQLPRIC
jgi:hydrogenase expression/formation protein HypE